MLEVVEPGLLTTVQDAGRPGAVALGVPVGGACDRWSLAAANALLGNEEAAPALEMTLSGATFRAREDCAIGIGGAEMEGRVVETGAAVRSGSALVLRTGQTLAFGTAVDGGGVRAYLALAGGIDVPRVLGSASTCLAGGFGGLDGRPLRAGDVVRPREPGAPAARVAAGYWSGPPVVLGDELRVLRGPHLDQLGGPAWADLLEREWRVSGRGDRQGIRLDGEPLARGAAASAADGPAMLSEGVVWGAVQVPPDGAPIVLLADHQTVGGYPVLAVVISADRPLLGQLGPGAQLRFVEASAPEARAALLRRRQAADAAMGQSAST